MAAREVAQSVPALDISGLIAADKPFWCGPDSMAAPHLPVGSVERAALFRALRETFCEDWKLAEESMLAERYVGMGDLYFMLAGNAVKVGHSKNVKERMRNVQTHNHEKVTLALWLKGQGWREKEFHRRFRRWHMRGEWFERCPEIEAEIERLSNVND